MSRLLLFLIALFLTIKGESQPIIYPDTFQHVTGYKSVTLRADYLTAGRVTKNIPVARYLFDQSGNTLANLTLCANRVCGKHTYSYSGNRLVSHKNYNSWTPYMKDIKESAWDSTLLSNEIRFTYTGDRLSGFSYYMQGIETVFMEKTVQYDPAGKIVGETFRTYYDSITEKLQTVHYAITDKKEYRYKDTVTTIKYYRNAVLQSTEEIISNSKGKVLNSVLKSLDGKQLNRYSYKYNDGMLLVEMTSQDTGYDGFGNTFDLLANEKPVYFYDAAGKLIRKEDFYKGRVALFSGMSTSNKVEIRGRSV